MRSNSHRIYDDVEFYENNATTNKTKSSHGVCVVTLSVVSVQLKLKNVENVNKQKIMYTIYENDKSIYGRRTPRHFLYSQSYELIWVTFYYNFTSPVLLVRLGVEHIERSIAYVVVSRMHAVLQGLIRIVLCKCVSEIRIIPYFQYCVICMYMRSIVVAQCTVEFRVGMITRSIRIPNSKIPHILHINKLRFYDKQTAISRGIRNNVAMRCIYEQHPYGIYIREI